MSDSEQHEKMREKLKTELDTAAWEWLKPHAERDAIILVDEELDLVHVAASVAAGDMTKVEAWMKKGEIKKPSAAQLDAWNSDGQRPFLFLIIQPFVFIQVKSN